MAATSDGGVKHDQGKTRWDLVPWRVIEALAEVYTFGATKYGDRNWELGLDENRLFAAMMRHLAARRAGHRLDDESRLPHIIHALWNLVAMAHFELEKDNVETTVSSVPTPPVTGGVREDDPGPLELTREGVRTGAQGFPYVPPWYLSTPYRSSNTCPPSGVCGASAVGKHGSDDSEGDI